MRSHYEVLGAVPTSTHDELHRAYRSAVRRAHPDTGGDDAEFGVVHGAWQVLGDPVRRAAYDRWLMDAAATVAPAPAEPVPWRRPTTGLPPARLTAVGPVLLSGSMLVAVLLMVGPVPAGVGAAYVVATALLLVRRGRDRRRGLDRGLDRGTDRGTDRAVRVVLTGAWVLAVGLGLVAALAPSTDRSPTVPLLMTMCTVVFATAASAAAYLQTTDRASGRDA